ncbi:MAG: GntR family transcriptional regulator [Desulfohalobiaceae bacterium]
MVRRIQDDILDGHIANGDMLPSERELKERFNISRGTLREALRVLEDRGLLEIRKGNKGGIFVRNITTEHASESLAILIRSQEVSLEHLAEFRQSVEGDIAALAAQKATSEEIFRLQSIAESAAAYLHNDPTEYRNFYALDQSFHIELARITENPVYLMIAKSVHANIMKYYEDHLEMGPGDMRENIEFFFDLVDILRLRQVKEARILAESHVMHFGRKMLSRQGRSDSSLLVASYKGKSYTPEEKESRYDESDTESPHSRQ